MRCSFPQTFLSLEHRYVSGRLRPRNPSQITVGYHIRLLRYFRLIAPLSRDIVLLFGTPPRIESTGQLKYKRTSGFVAEKLGDRLTRRWL